jgi:transcriptional regulator with XRE-family HTH domain
MPLTARQLRHRLKRLKISQRGLARRLRVHPRTVQRWVAGDSPIPEAVGLLLDAWKARPPRS